MAIVAVNTAGNVCRVLTDRYHAVMTGPTGTQYLRVVNGERRCPDVRVVAVLANIRRRNMCIALANSFDAIVTTDARTRDADVVEIGRQPAGGCMTVVTIVAAGDVRRVFASCRHAIVSRAAGAQNLCMVNGECWRVGHSAVAILANVGGLDVRWSLAGGCDAIVTGDAIANDAGVIEKGGQPTSNIMAIVALIVG